MEPSAQIPVRTRLTVLRDGREETTCLVFCEARLSTVAMSRCTACGFGGAIHRDAAGAPVAIECARATLSSTVPPAPQSGVRVHPSSITRVASTLSIGHALVRPVLCVADDVPLAVAAAVLERAPSAYGLPVVARDARLIGVLPRATVALLLSESSESATLPAGSALLPIHAIDEQITLTDAFSDMCRRHAREVAVVGRDGDIVGTLSDVDALRFVAHFSRTGARPRLDDMPRAASDLR